MLECAFVFLEPTAINRIHTTLAIGKDLFRGHPAFPPIFIKASTKFFWALMRSCDVEDNSTAKTQDILDCQFQPAIQAGQAPSRTSTLLFGARLLPSCPPRLECTVPFLAITWGL